MHKDLIFGLPLILGQDKRRSQKNTQKHSENSEPVYINPTLLSIGV